jgi:uncharacterized protein YmfQ (DUF2313 family)
MTRAPDYSAADIQAGLASLAPQGRAWSRDAGSSFMLSLGALSPTHQRSAIAAAALLVDAVPTTTTALLPEWEFSLGLPDRDAPPTQTISERQAAAAAKWAARGGQTPAYFIRLAAILGYVITITQFAPFKFGQTFGSPLLGGAWAHAWQANVPTFTVQPFQFGDAFGTAFASFGGTYLQRKILSGSPAHTVLIFNYADGPPPVVLGDFILGSDYLG